MMWNYFTLRHVPRDSAPCEFASYWWNQPIDNTDKRLMLHRCKTEIESLEFNILAVQELEPIYKPNGDIHKTKMSERTKLIKKWEKEIKNFTKWYDSYKMKGAKVTFTSEDFRKYWLYSSQFIVKE